MGGAPCEWYLNSSSPEEHVSGFRSLTFMTVPGVRVTDPVLIVGEAHLALAKLGQ